MDTLLGIAFAGSLAVHGRESVPARVLCNVRRSSRRHAATLRKAVGKSSSRRWIAALRTVWPSCVMRQRRERGIFATRPRRVEAFDEAGDLRAAPATGRRAGSEQPGAHVTVAEALEEAFAVEHGGEQG